LDTQIKFYAALAASAIPDHSNAIRLFSLIKDSGYEEFEVYQRLCYEYDQTGDSLALVGVLKEGVLKFPKEEYFLLNLIDKSIKSGNIEEAVSYIKVAIEKNPQDPIFYDALGVVYENAERYELAIEYYQKALTFKPDLSVYKHLGNLYNNLGIKSRAKADELSEKKLADEELAKSTEYFTESLKYFEKAFEIDPKDFDVISYLRFIYYSLKKGDEFEKMDNLYNNFQKE
jgi:tetratricopeptide (TPR) repeat protein